MDKEGPVPRFLAAYEVAARLIYPPTSASLVLSPVQAAKEKLAGLFVCEEIPESEYRRPLSLLLNLGRVIWASGEAAGA